MPKYGQWKRPLHEHNPDIRWKFHHKWMYESSLDFERKSYIYIKKEMILFVVFLKVKTKDNKSTPSRLWKTIRHLHWKGNCDDIFCMHISVSSALGLLVFYPLMLLVKWWSANPCLYPFWLLPMQYSKWIWCWSQVSWEESIWSQPCLCSSFFVP